MEHQNLKTLVRAQAVLHLSEVIMTLSSRKFILAVGTLIFAGFVEITNGGVTDGFITLAAMVNGIYVTGNVYKHHVDLKRVD